MSTSDPVALSNHTKAVVAFSLVQLHRPNLKPRLAQSQHSGDPPATGADRAEGASRPHSQAAVAAGKEAVGGSAAAQRMQPPGGGREVTGNTEGEWGQGPREPADGDREGDVESPVTQPKTALVPRGRWPNSHPNSMRIGYTEAVGPQFSL